LKGLKTQKTVIDCKHRSKVARRCNYPNEPTLKGAYKEKLYCPYNGHMRLTGCKKLYPNSPNTPVIYTTPNCINCKRLKRWLTEHNIDFVEESLNDDILTTLILRNIHTAPAIRINQLLFGLVEKRRG